MLGEFWARANKAHLSAKDVEDLGQFIKFPAAQELTNRGESLVKMSSNDGTVHMIAKMRHGTKLEDGESPAVAPHPLLAKEDWAAGSEAHRKPDQQTYGNE